MLKALEDLVHRLGFSILRRDQNRSFPIGHVDARDVDVVLQPDRTRLRHGGHPMVRDHDDRRSIVQMERMDRVHEPAKALVDQRRRPGKFG